MITEQDIAEVRARIQRARMSKQAALRGTIARLLGRAAKVPKKTGMKAIPSIFLQALPFAIAGGAITAGGAAVGKGMEVLKHAVTTKRHYHAMLREFPDLEKRFGKQRVIRHWKSLRTFNPMIAADPLASGTLVKNSLELGGGLDVQTIASLAKSRKEIERTRLSDRIADALKTGLTSSRLEG